MAARCSTATGGSPSVMRAHLGCGAVLLRDYVNIDLPLPHVYLTRERPDLVERFITTEDQYYARHVDKNADALRGGAVTKDTVCDIYGSFTFIPARPGTVSEILARQVFEHLDRAEAKAALRHCHEALRSNGILRLDIPDPDETLRRYRESGDEFYIRHLFGPRRDVYGFHTHYTRRMLIEMAEKAGFSFLQEEDSPHFYPAFTLRFAAVK